MALEIIKKSRTYDIWGEDEGIHTTASQRRRNNKKLPHFEKPVTLPHPGQSYNPRPEDHEALLQKIAEKELKLKRREAALQKEFSGTKVTKQELEELELREQLAAIEHQVKITSGLNNSEIESIGGKNSSGNENNDEDDSTDDGEYDVADYDSMLKDRTVKEKRKTQAQKYRQLRDRLQRKQAKLRKLHNIRLSKFNAIKSITRKVEQELWLREQLAASRRRRHRQRAAKLAQKFERSDPVYCLPSELPSSLRQIKCPLDAMVRERLESWQARQLVEPTSRQSRKLKYERKHFERRCAEER